jgi:large subunit ribosomal protein L13
MLIAVIMLSLSIPRKLILLETNGSKKKYIRYTGYPGGQRSLNATEQFEKNPNSIIEKSVKGMLPKNKLGADLFRNLHVFADSDHKFEAQKPSSIDLNKVN